MATMIADDINFDEYLLAEDDGISKVRPASEFADEVIALFHGETVESVGHTTPWAKVGDNVRFRPGEVSLWAGINGHGKSGALGYVVLDAMSQGARACIASMEMKAFKTMGRMARQAAGTACPSAQFIADFHRWTDNRLWIYNQTGQVHWRRMIAVSRYCREELGIDHMVIDSLMKCGIAPDDYAGQKNFVDALCALARDTGIHIHLVHHVRKSDSEKKNVPDKFDIKGAGEIVDLVDNAFIVYRNKAKESALVSLNKPTDTEKREPWLNAPDTILICAKQRHFGWEGEIKLWFDGKSEQLTPAREAGVRYLDLNAGDWKQGWKR